VRKKDVGKDQPFEGGESAKRWGGFEGTAQRTD